MKKFYTLILLFSVGLFSGVRIHAQLTAPGATITQTTNYTNGATNDPIFIFCSPTATGQILNPSLTATPPSGVPGWTFNWFTYNLPTNSWTPLSTESNVPTSTISGLASGGYRVVITDGGGNIVGCYRAWVWFKNNTVTINPVAAGCSAFVLSAAMTTQDNFTYYNPPADPFPVSATTQVTVCFTAPHTYVSDLGFFLIGPPSCGSPVIPLAPHPEAINAGNGCCCNGGDNVNNLCFSTQNTNLLAMCGAPTPLTGTFGIYGQGTPGNYNTNNNNWSPIYGCDATQGGWSVQIYDCIGADVGALTNATISFTGVSSCGPSTITYNSGNINSTINDNSCTPQTASIYTVPAPPGTVAQTLTSSTTYQWTSNPAYAFPTPTGGSAVLPQNIDPSPTVDTWFYLTATNSLGCTTVDSVFFDYIPPVPPVITQPTTFCFGAAAVNLQVSETGGVWSGTGITDTQLGTFDPVLAGPGTHQIIYETPPPCGAPDTIWVTVAPEITFSETISNLSCFNSGDGAISLNILSGDAPVTAEWNTVPVTQALSINNLNAGNYSVVVSDAYGCEVTADYTVTEPTEIVLNTNFTDVNCPGGTNGSATVVAAGGTAPYTYSWTSNPVQNTATANGLPQGSYTVTVTDDNNCSEQASVQISTLSSSPQFQAQITDESCPDVFDGEINVSLNGGTGPFNYSWSHGPATEDVTGMTGGNYTLTVTDTYNCNYSQNFTVGTGNSINGNVLSSDILCNGIPTGTITIVPLSGNPPYTYYLNGSASGSNQFSNLPAGNYTIIMVDSRGCDTTFTASISEPPPLTTDSTYHQIQLGDYLTLSPGYGGGTGNLSIYWIPSYNLSCNDCPNPLAWPTNSTHYSLVVTDANGCEANSVVQVDVFHDGPFIPNAFTPANLDQLNNVWYVSDYGVKTFNALIVDRWGQKVFETDNIYQGWDGKNKRGTLYPQGVYVYKVDIVYIDGTEKTLLGHVTLIR
ncbi:MAG: gliding motility-associated C-terminal domain-containing protein [Flavobacteriales bacterium]|nr:gliding motility-associated C-terminal domain-containing protein [Flavobacteriales bacterium]